MTVLTLTKALPRLQKAYQEHRLIPFLGAGFSAPLRLPTWSGLMRWMGGNLGFDPPELFEVHGNAQQLAGYFELEHPERLMGFIQEMRERFHHRDVDKQRRTSIQHQALAGCDFRTLYTTNFEHHIERALRDRNKKRKVLTLTRLEDFMKPVDPTACSVIKFHGDLAHPETIVLTESQFFDRHRLEAAPDQRLRSDLLGNVFLFVGYSFSDPNIRYIWHRMDRLRKESRKGTGASSTSAPLKSYWVTFGAGRVQPRLLEEWNIDVIELDASDKSASVAELLNQLHA
ncbi:SIR2 family protein [Corallococcus exiguus]|uniref:SIR2 family protein n=1 Tax=Corallococcus exiguus TaxID=83462 RepID=A0A7X4Y852_9BACT|nr:SIR2 family protein [Corallococcus exiguus]NBC39562.1 SIR2 family protein [Corallococcus exiguus]NPD26512.1 SIR2 family protein [Corallococcus exiguus]NRD48090.1 SIR2 family protein [Corallococcus exiguus]TNV67584.1 SIR2 family protein [Corallococcus exiguus]